MQQGELLGLLEEMMLFTRFSQKIELVDAQECSALAYKFIDRENELRQSKPPTTQPPPRVPLDPWARSRLMRQDAPPKEEKTSDSDP
ncbi:hypothetical protein YC2023_073033 [Brassica napus]